MSFVQRKTEQNVRAASKSLFVNDKKQRGNEKKAAVEPPGSMMKFVKPNVKMIKDDTNFDLLQWDVEFANRCEERLVERSKTARNCCGNSPFCDKETHRHGQDSTLFGRLEDKVRRSVWTKRNKKDETLQNLSMLPFYVKKTSRDERIEKQNLFVSKHRKQMNDDEFIRGVKNGDLACLVLAQWRIYYSECINIMMTLDGDKRRIEEDRARQQSEAAASYGNDREVNSVNEYASKQHDILGSVATNRMRLVGIRANNELKNLLQRHNVQRISLAQQSLFQMMLRNHYKNDEEVAKLDLIRSELEKYTGEIPRGRFFNDEDEVPEWEPFEEKKEPEQTVSPALLIDLSKEKDSDDEEQQQRRKETPTKKRTWAEYEIAKKPALLSYKPVCKSQFSYGDGGNACTSICLNVAGTLAQSVLSSKDTGLTELEYIEHSIAWAELVKTGLFWYHQRKNKKVEFEHVMELLESGERSEGVKKNFDFEEHTGSIFQEKIDPKTTEELFDQQANPDLETAFEMCDKLADGRLPYACMITFHSHTIAISSHRHGWHIFDSKGSVVAGMSVLFTVETRAEAIEVIKYLFNYDSLKKQYDKCQLDASVELDYKVSYSMFCLVLKKEEETE